MQSNQPRRVWVAIALAIAVVAVGVVVAEPAVQSPEQAWGAGFTTWWRDHGKEVAEFAACAVEGLGIARVLTGGGAIGGVLGAAALVAGALGCV